MPNDLNDLNPIINPNTPFTPAANTSSKSPTEQKVNQQVNALPAKPVSESGEKKLTGTPPPSPELTAKTDQIAKTQMMSEETEINEIEVCLYMIQEGDIEKIPSTVGRILDGMIRNNGNDPEKTASYSKLADTIVALTKDDPEAKEIQTAVKIAKQLVSRQLLSDSTNFNDALQQISEDLKITPEDVQREARLFARKDGGELNLLLANLKMVKRGLLLVSADRNPDKGSIMERADKTGYPLVVVETCEKMFSRLIQQKKLDKAQPRVLEGYVIIPGYTQGKAVVLVEEVVLGAGAFKDTSRVANYAEINHPKDQKYVTKRNRDPYLPSPKVKPHTATPPPPPMPRTETEENLTEKLKKMGIGESVHAYGVPLEAAQPNMSNTMIINDGSSSLEGTQEEEIGNTQIINEDDEEEIGNTQIINEDDEEIGNTQIINEDDEEEIGNTQIINEDDEEIGNTQIINEDDEEEIGNTQIIHDDEEEWGNTQIIHDDENEAEENNSAAITESSSSTEFFSVQSEGQTIENYYSFNNPSLLAKEIQAPLARSIKATPPRVHDPKPKDLEDIKDTKKYEKEIRLQQALQGPGIEPIHMIVETVTGKQVIVCKEAGYDISDDKHVIDLDGYNRALPVDKQTKEDKLQVLTMLRDGLVGLDHMHSKGFVHKDIKPQNTLINPDGSLVLTDFGLTRHLKDKKINRTEGTCHYMAPETCAQRETTSKSDIWSFGMMVQMLTHGSTGKQWNNGILKVIPNPNALHPLMILQKLGEIIADPNKRKEYEEEFKEPADKNSVDYIVWSATRVDPKQRPTAKELISILDNIILNENV